MVLEQNGNTVRTLGSTVIGGLACSGYIVTPSRQAMLATVRKEIAAGMLSAGSANVQLGVMQLLPVPTYRVWFDANGLMRQLMVSLRLGSMTGVQPGDSVMRFLNYGTPVRIAAPASSDTVPYRSFVKGFHVSIGP
jgi:hypothetical protein